MPVTSTPAIVLHTFPYGETSKIVRLATRDHGVVSAIAKGAQRAKSRFGARLQPLSDGTAQLYMKANRDLQTLSEFDLSHTREGLARDLRRFTAGVALAEVVMRFAPQEPLGDIYQSLSARLDAMADCARDQVEVVALAALWAVVATLGFAPEIGVCALDGEALPEGDGHFSVADGGLLCGACARSRATADLGSDDRRALGRLARGAAAWPDGAPIALDPRHAAAHRRLLARFVRQHLAEGRDLKALDQWEDAP